MTDPTTNDEDGPGQPEPFSSFLFAQRKGATHGELTDGLAELLQAVMDTGKAGTLTLQIKVSKATKNGGNQMFVADTVTVKAPKAAREESLFFFDERTSSLSRNDPTQPALPLQEVPAPTNKLREA